MDTEYQGFIKCSYSVTLPSLALVTAGSFSLLPPFAFADGFFSYPKGKTRLPAIGKGRRPSGVWSVPSFPCDRLAPKRGGKAISLLSEPIYPPLFFFRKEQAVLRFLN